jgi:large repetitive protein
VVTRTENDPIQNAIDPLIRIDYFARVNNDLATNSGDALGNSVVTTYTHGQTGAPETLTGTTAPVTVVEPLLTATKTVRNVTPGKQSGDPAGGGDRLEYVITLPNSGTATAHDVNIVDTLSAGQALDTGFTPTATINGAAVTGFVPTPADAPFGPLIWGRDNGDANLDIPVGQSLVLTYRVVVLEATGTLGNSMWADWTSLDGLSGYERTGAGCPDWTAPNDYCTGPATTATATVDENRIAKSIVADTYDVPDLSTAVDGIARVGDVVTYRLALTLRGGLTRDVRVEDLLPAGMIFVETVRINGDTSAPYAPPASGPGSNFSYSPISAVPATGATGTLVWTIGDVTNDPYGDATTDTLEIVYRARIAPDNGLSHVAVMMLANTATLHYTDAPARSAGAAATLHQPIIHQIAKRDRDGRTSPLSVLVATDIMRFQLEACNSGQAPAYSVAIYDQLATELDHLSIANLAVAVDGTPLDPGGYTYTAPDVRGGQMRFLLNSPVNPNQCLTIDYDIGFNTDFGENLVWHNQATVDAYWSLPAQSGQRYGPVGPATFYMHNVATTEAPEKILVSPNRAKRPSAKRSSTVSPCPVTRKMRPWMMW